MQDSIFTSQGLSAVPHHHGAPRREHPLQPREHAFSVACVRSSFLTLLTLCRRTCPRCGAGGRAPCTCAYAVASRCVAGCPALAAVGQLPGAPDDDFTPFSLRKKKTRKKDDWNEIAPHARTEKVRLLQ